MMLVSRATRKDMIEWTRRKENKLRLIPLKLNKEQKNIKIR